MPKVNPNENLISIDPPLAWDEIKNGPALSALEMVFDSWAVGTSVATGIRLASGGRIDDYLDRELQQVVNHYSGHVFSGRIEIRYGHAQGAPAERVVVRGPHVVRLAAVLGWPPDQVDDTGVSEGHLMDILAERNVCVADERYAPADETDLPDVLLAWRDAAVKAAVAGQLVAPGSGEYPGTSGAVWRDADGEAWMLCDDGRMRLRDRGPGVDPGEIARIYGPMTLAGGA